MWHHYGATQLAFSAWWEPDCKVRWLAPKTRDRFDTIPSQKDRTGFEDVPGTTITGTLVGSVGLFPFSNSSTGPGGDGWTGTIGGTQDSLLVERVPAVNNVNSTWRPYAAANVSALAYNIGAGAPTSMNLNETFTYNYDFDGFRQGTWTWGNVGGASGDGLTLNIVAVPEPSTLILSVFAFVPMMVRSIVVRNRFRNRLR